MKSILRKVCLLASLIVAAGSVLAGPTTDEWQPKITGNIVKLNTTADSVSLDATAIKVTHPYYTHGALEFGIYSFKRKNGQLQVVNSLALINPVFTGATGNIEFDRTTNTASNGLGDSANIGNRFGWYISNGSQTRYSHKTLNNYNYDYLELDKKNSSADADLYWEMFFYNCDAWFDDLVVAIDFSIPDPVAVSEPRTLGLLLAAMGMLFYVRRRKHSHSMAA